MVTEVPPAVVPELGAMLPNVGAAETGITNVITNSTANYGNNGPILSNSNIHFSPSPNLSQLYVLHRGQTFGFLSLFGYHE